jgi:UDP-2-acetamido-3-amino-2,3-dideoxy-glucuronate N-acetyltransferase
VTATGDLARADDWTVTPIHLADGASIGAGAVIVAGCDVGPYAMVGAGAVVTHPVPGHALVAGNPARRIGWVCACGARLAERDGGRFVCPSCEREYVYLPDGETLEERSGPVVKQGAPA